MDTEPKVGDILRCNHDHGPDRFAKQDQLVKIVSVDNTMYEGFIGVMIISPRNEEQKMWSESHPYWDNPGYFDKI